MNYFEGCYTIHDAKKRFRELTKIHHPDVGGDVKIMQQIVNQYDNFIPSRQPHDNSFNRFRKYSHPTQEQTKEWNERFYGQKQYSNQYTSSEYNFSSIPFNHPLYLELRELRAKFNYGMDEENRILKIKVNEMAETISRLDKEYNFLNNKFKEYKKKMKEKKMKSSPISL